MPRRALDTNILVSHWIKVTRGIHPAALTTEQAARWGRELAKLLDTDLTLTPVCLEFICGQRSSHEVQLARAYLGTFRVADKGTILDQDWVEARRIAERVPRDGLRRQLGDCLIRAICNRLKLDVLTAEKRFPR